jgi:hypothetical protein
MVGVIGSSPVHQDRISGVLADLGAERESLTRELRQLAARLDELDRVSSYRGWQNAPLSAEAIGLDQFGQHSELTAGLHRLAARLQELDERIAETKQQGRARCGICPECGYPTIESSVCAFCRPGAHRRQ